VTGDHGEGLGDHGELTHGMLAYDSTLRVPLVIAFPPNLVLPPKAVLPPKGGSYRDSGGQAEDSPVSLADLAGSLVRAAGLAVPAGMRPGLLGADSEAYAETEYPRTAGWHDLAALAFDRWKLVLSADAELYDVTADPGETRNLAADPPDRAPLSRLRAELFRFASADVKFADLAQLLQSQRERLEREDPEALRVIRALGY